MSLVVDFIWVPDGCIFRASYSCDMKTLSYADNIDWIDAIRYYGFACANFREPSDEAFEWRECPINLRKEIMAEAILKEHKLILSSLVDGYLAVAYYGDGLGNIGYLHSPTPIDYRSKDIRVDYPVWITKNFGQME